MSIGGLAERLHLWPRSLFGRLTLILFFGLIAAHILTFGLIAYERTQAARAMMVRNLGKEVASAVAILERVPPAERPLWLPRLERSNYRYVLGTDTVAGTPVPETTFAQAVLASISDALGSSYSVAVSSAEGSQMGVHLHLADGTALTIEMLPSSMMLSFWVPLILFIQLAILAVFTWLAVRLATRPLMRLALAADSFGADLAAAPLPEDGPLEVGRAAIAFNAMQRRIAEHLAERMQILAAVSHDLQTPITRMRLRADLMDNALQRDKMLGDLTAMQMLVEEGIAYARNAQGVNEAVCRTDLDALLDSLVYDYLDAGQSVGLRGKLGTPLETRPHTLRRILTNLVDNALKFGGDVEIHVQVQAGVAITVLDRGPGIPQSELTAVLQPFYRLEGSRNRETGGTGLGLAIAHQLASAMGASLSLSNREGGGLQARLLLLKAA